MSAWPWPTTADVALRAFAPSYESLLIESALGVQTLLASPEGNIAAPNQIRHYGEWQIQCKHSPHDKCMLLVTWLEEVLYRQEIHNQWFLDGAVKIEQHDSGLTAIVQVTWVQADLIERELEIKAVTTHKLAVERVAEGATLQPPDPDVPEFQGPGWYCDVVFDI